MAQPSDRKLQVQPDMLMKTKNSSPSTVGSTLARDAPAAARGTATFLARSSEGPQTSISRFALGEICGI